VLETGGIGAKFFLDDPIGTGELGYWEGMDRDIKPPETVETIGLGRKLQDGTDNG
jgi:hypothetical protein